MSRLKSLTDILAVTRTELLQLRRSRTAILVSLVVIPLFFTSSLGAGRGGAGSSFSPTAELSIAFIDNDLTAVSGSLYENLATSGDFNNLIQGYREDSALATLGTGRIVAAIVIPKGFQEKLVTGQAGVITVYIDDGEPGVDDAVTSALRKNIQIFNPNLGTSQTQRSQPPGSAGEIQIIRKGTLFSGFAIGLTIVLGLVIIFATFYEIAGGMSRESEEGTYARLLVSPTSLGSIILGKTLYDLFLNVVRTFTVVGLAVYVYGARLGTDLGTLLAASLLLALLTMGFGFLVSSLGLGVRSVVIIEFFLVLFLFAFSGFIIDRELLRGISKTIAFTLPWAYGIEILKRTALVGQPLTSLTYEVALVVVSIIAFYSVSYVLLRLSRERLVK